MTFTFREYLTFGTHAEHQFGMPTLSTLSITRDKTTFCREKNNNIMNNQTKAIGSNVV